MSDLRSQQVQALRETIASAELEIERLKIGNSNVKQLSAIQERALSMIIGLAQVLQASIRNEREL